MLPQESRSPSLGDPSVSSQEVSRPCQEPAAQPGFQPPAGLSGASIFRGSLPVACHVGAAGEKLLPPFVARQGLPPPSAQRLLARLPLAGRRSRLPDPSLRLDQAGGGVISSLSTDTLAGYLAGPVGANQLNSRDRSSSSAGPSAQGRQSTPPPPLPRVSWQRLRRDSSQGQGGGNPPPSSFLGKCRIDPAGAEASPGTPSLQALPALDLRRNGTSQMRAGRAQGCREGWGGGLRCQLRSRLEDRVGTVRVALDWGAAGHPALRLPSGRGSALPPL